jgi:hypothetical protein
VKAGTATSTRRAFTRPVFQSFPSKLEITSNPWAPARCARTRPSVTGRISTVPGERPSVAPVTASVDRSFTSRSTAAPVSS